MFNESESNVGTCTCCEPFVAAFSPPPDVPRAVLGAATVDAAALGAPRADVADDDAVVGRAETALPETTTHHFSYC